MDISNCRYPFGTSNGYLPTHKRKSNYLSGKQESRCSHPDIVERLWKGIGTKLDTDCRLIVCGTPALVQPVTGNILAIALGTQYCLHLPAPGIKTALAAGASTTTKWFSRRMTNAAKEFGEGWIFGKWLKEEIGWCRESYQVFGLSGK